MSCRNGAEVDVTHTYEEGGPVTTLIEQHVHRHSQQIDPPWWEEMEFENIEKARAWVQEQTRMTVVLEHEIND